MRLDISVDLAAQHSMEWRCGTWFYEARSSHCWPALTCFTKHHVVVLFSEARLREPNGFPFIVMPMDTALRSMDRWIYVH